MRFTVDCGMPALIATDRVFPEDRTCARTGEIVRLPAKTAWFFGHSGLGGLGIVLFPHWDAALVFLILTGITICAGHSVGMHRLLIHRSFATPKSVERILVYLGTLVGMAGPFGMIRAHDMRDWHQRQATCPPHPSHGAGFWRDAGWQLCCEFRLARPPTLRIEREVADDPFYLWLDRTWMVQQGPLALILFLFGGWAWVLWGISLRVAISLFGHWAVGHFSHKRGQQGWRVEGVPVQGYNLPGLGLIAFGENWHGNHHAFPHSALLGVEKGQFDPGFLFVKALERIGLARDIKLPDSAPPRTGLTRT